MNMTKLSTTVTFTGESGTKYKFETYTTDTSFNNVSAVYMFVKRFKKTDGTYSQKPLYIGESSQLGTRITNHDKWECVEENGCTHISVMTIKGAQARIDAETDLRNGYPNTPCNDQ
jgi:hypothetical protein